MSPTCSLLHFREAASFYAYCSQSFTTYDTQSCPRRVSPHRKIVMHVNSTVHGSNEPWQWMLSDFKRQHPYAHPSVCLPSTCMCEEYVTQTGWVRGSKITGSKSHMRALQRASKTFSHAQNTQKYANNCTQYHRIAALNINLV